MNSIKERLEALDTSADALKELNDAYSKTRAFMRRWGIGYKIKSFREEPGVLGKIRKAIQLYMGRDAKPDKTPSKLGQEMKDEIRKKVDKDELPNKEMDYKVNRIVRTETAAIRELNKLLKWKGMGFTKVKHKTHFSKNTGEKDKRFNGRVFKIDYLLKHPDDRVPLHPFCKCAYTLFE